MEEIEENDAEELLSEEEELPEMEEEPVIQDIMESPEEQKEEIAITCTVEGQTISFPKKYQSWHILYHDYEIMRQEVWLDYAKWYDTNLETMISDDNFFDKIVREGSQRIGILVDWSIAEMVKRGYLYLSRSSFVTKYGAELDMEQHLTPIYDKYAEIICTEQELAAYQQAKKESRGYWQGGGFGLKGALKGAVTASALNMGSSMFHAVFDGISASGDRRKIHKMKSNLFHQDQTKRTVLSAWFQCTKSVFENTADELAAADLLIKQPIDSGKARSLSENAKQFVSDRAKYIAIMLESICYNPLSTNYYTAILNYIDYPHFELCQLADYFGAGRTMRRWTRKFYNRELSKFLKQLNLSDDDALNLRRKKVEVAEWFSQFTKTRDEEPVAYYAAEFRDSELASYIKRLDDAEHKILYTVDDYTFNNAEEVEQYKREKVVFNRFRQEWHEYEYGCEYEEKIRVFLKLISAGLQTECLQGKILSYLPQIQEAYSKYCRTEFQTWRDTLRKNRMEVYTMLKEERQAEVRAMMEERIAENGDALLPSYQKAVDEAESMMDAGCTCEEVKAVLQNGLYMRIPFIEDMYARYALERYKVNRNEENIALINALLNDSAMAGYINSQFAMMKLRTDDNSLPFNINVWKFWLSCSAENGHPQAQADLSYEFIRGTYFPKNYEIAKYWMQKGLDQGEPEAEFVYGDALYHGTVFPMDKEKGLWHIKKAAAGGNEIAIKVLEKLGIELILCPNCGNPIKNTDKFCGKCGCKLQASGEV